MKIVLVGFGGVGKHVEEELQKIGDVIVAMRSIKEYPVDLSDKGSIERLFKKVGECDHVVVTAGKAVLKPFDDATDEDYRDSIAAKLQGQIDVVRVGSKYIKKGGSFTLTTGYLSHVLVSTVAIPALVNAAIERFIVNVAMEKKGDFRINGVSPAMLEESMEVYGTGVFNKFPVVSGGEVAKVYHQVIESNETGIVKRVGWRVEDIEKL